MLAFKGDRPVGHILFTAASLLQTQRVTVIAILAPLAIVPDFQKQGIGGKLIERGLQLLDKSGVELVFVLGHPEYYQRYGFKQAGQLGFETPYPIPEQYADAWMVRALHQDMIGTVSGKVICANVKLIILLERMVYHQGYYMKYVGRFLIYLP